jgi:uncharacterized membrane protein
MRPAVLEHLPWRIAGVILLGVLVVAYQPHLDDVINRLVIPIAMALATWLMVQNAVAVAVGAGALAAVHSAPGSGDWVVAAAYPALAGLCALIVLALLVQRFRRRIADTHHERWQRRRERGDGDEGGP